ncbi:MAG: Fur family transcriptional regulator [Patescibacteria group bacterium]
MEDILKNKGYKLTKPRLAILGLMKKQHNLFTAQELYKKLKQKYDLASVYRTLNLFNKLNIVEEEIIKNESFYYIAKKHHHHIICRKCGCKQCVPCKNIDLRIKNFSIIKHQLSLTGICKNCF